MPYEEGFRRGQASSEYLIVSSLTLLIVIPAVFAFFQYSNQKTLQIEENQIMSLGSRITIDAQKVFNGGQGTKITLTDRFPAILDTITFVPKSPGPGGEFVIYYEAQQSSVGPLSVGFPVYFDVALNSTGTNWGQGLRNIVFVAQQNSTGPNLYVNVSIQ